MAEKPGDHKRHGSRGMYLRFFGMIVTASVLMYVFTYLNTYAWNHIFFSEERVYMTLTMTAMMAVIMLSFMLPMLSLKRLNFGIYVGSVVLFAVALWLARSQTTVQDVSYMRAMIPHHSIAILTSERAEITDPRVRELANEIMKAQRREISMMKTLIDDIDAHGEQVPSERPVAELRLGPKVPPSEASAAQVPDGFRVEVVMSGLTYPTSVEFDDSGAMYVAEAGYSYGDSSETPRILRVTTDGEVGVVASGSSLVGPVNDLLWHEGQMYVSHRGLISVIESSGEVRDLVEGLPSDGDHHNNQLAVGPDGKIYFGQGTATNSGVVGLDNFKMGWLKDHPEFHDVPARDITLVEKLFESPNPPETTDELVQTLPFHPFGAADTDELTVPGQTKANGTILRMNSDGSELEVYAWGLRNPYGVMWSPDGKLYATENGFDVRGSRPIANDKEDIYIIKEDAWYGWPDYAMGLPITSSRFKPKDKPQPQFLMAEHPPVEQPWMNFPTHSAIAKVAFSRSDAFGQGRMFVAFFGHMVPMTGRAPDEHGGHRVVRIDPATKEMETFFGKTHGHGGRGGSSQSGSEDGHAGDGHGDGGHGNGGVEEGGGEQSEKSAGHGGGDDQPKSFTPGPRRLLDVLFSPDGEALYIADFGALKISAGAVPVPETGVIWRVVPVDAEPPGPPTKLSPPK